VRRRLAVQNSNSVHIKELHVMEMSRDLRNIISLKAEAATQSIAATFWYISKFIFRLSTMNISSFDSTFASTYLCEEAFSQMTIIKRRYRTLLTDTHLKCCLHLCLIMNPLSVSYRKTCSVRYQLRNRKFKEKDTLIMVNC
jgi:hypothetical protein